MPDSVLTSIDLDRYFSLLADLVPEAHSFVVCECIGDCNTAADGCNGTANACVDYSCADASTQQEDTPSDCRLARHTDSDLRVTITDRMGDTAAYLQAAVSGDCITQEQTVLITEKLARVAGCLQEEYRLTKELNSMARELTGRYEELNLVYDNRDEFVDINQGNELLQSIVMNCVVYLDVDMVALTLPGQDKQFCATNRNNQIPDADELTTSLTTRLYDHILENSEHIILNDINSNQHRRMCPDIPYKVLATPVINADSEVIGMLACLNHNQRPDFYNSGRSVLSVMARKVSKVIMTSYDSLTGLLTGRAFDSVISRDLNAARLTGQTSCLLNIDLDQLKIINDTHGREAGDAAIRQLGERIKGNLRKSDTVAYLGEGRFGVLVDKSTASHGITVAEMLRKQIEESTLNWKSIPVELTASIGLAVIDQVMPDADTALESAELARDTAKESGRNRIQIYHQGDKEIMQRKNNMRWVNRIQNAMRDERFLIYCQQIKPLKRQDEAYHFEILLRMIDEEGSIVSPEYFIAPAEQYHLMAMIDQWVIKSTFSQLSEHGIAQTPGEGLVSINLCGQSMTDKGIVERISKQMHQFGIEPGCICLEVTETAAIRNLDSARHIIKELRSIGCRFSLDDFGTGMSSFSYLKELPVDNLKIDGSFVRKVTDDQVARAMVTSINDIGHIMGLKTIAEYVENEAILHDVEVIGIDYAQGYEVMKPAPLKDYLHELLKGNQSLKTG